MANCGRMVRDSTMVTTESLEETTIDVLNSTIADPPKMGVPSAPSMTNFASRAATWQI